MMQWTGRAIFLTVLVSICVGCAPSFEERFPDQYTAYQAEPKHKALAFVQGGDGGYAYGYSSGRQTRQAAIKRALEQCSVRQQLYDVNGTCDIYMVNDRRSDD